MSILTDIINILSAIQKPFEISKTGVDTGKAILSPEEKKKLKNQEIQKESARDENNNLSTVSDSNTPGSPSESSTVSTDLTDSTSQKTEQLSRFTRIKNYFSQKVDTLREKYAGAKEYIKENYPRTSKVIGAISKVVDGTIGVLGGKTASRAFLIVSAGMLFASGVGTIPAAIMLGVSIAAVSVGVGLEAFKLRKVNKLKDENALTKEYLKTHEQLDQINKDNPSIEKFFYEKDEAAQKLIDLRNEQGPPKPNLFVRMQNAVPAGVRNVGKTLRDNLGEAGTYMAVSALTGNIFGMITSSIYFVFGHSTTVIERNTYDKLKTKLRNDTSDDAKQIPSYKNKYELQELLRQEYVERDTRKFLANDQKFHLATEKGDQNEMKSIYENARKEIDKSYMTAPKPGIFKAIGNYFNDIGNVIVKGVMPDESLNHYTDRKYNHSPQVYKNENKINEGTNAHAHVGDGNITKQLVQKAQELSYPPDVDDKNPSLSSMKAKIKDQRSL